MHYAEPDLDESARLSLYSEMVRARFFEKRAYDLFLQGLLKGTTHLGLGQEAVAAGFAGAMRADDMTLLHLPGAQPHAVARRTHGSAHG